MERLHPEMNFLRFLILNRVCRSTFTAVQREAVIPENFFHTSSGKNSEFLHNRFSTPRKPRRYCLKVSFARSRTTTPGTFKR
jgi:hypothetical protein